MIADGPVNAYLNDPAVNPAETEPLSRTQTPLAATTPAIPPMLHFFTAAACGGLAALACEGSSAASEAAAKAISGRAATVNVRNQPLGNLLRHIAAL